MWQRSVGSVGVGWNSRYWGLNDPFCCIHRSGDSQVPMLFTGPDNSQNCPLIRGISTSILGFVDPCESAPKRHFDRFSLFRRAHLCDEHTDHAACDIDSNGPHRCAACRRCGLETSRSLDQRWVGKSRIGGKSWKCWRNVYM